MGNKHRMPTALPCKDKLLSLDFHTAIWKSHARHLPGPNCQRPVFCTIHNCIGFHVFTTFHANNIAFISSSDGCRSVTTLIFWIGKRASSFVWTRTPARDTSDIQSLPVFFPVICTILRSFFFIKNQGHRTRIVGQGQFPWRYCLLLLPLSYRAADSLR